MTDKQAPLQVGKRIAGGQGLSQVLLRRASEVELDWDVRQKSRIEATDSLGRALNVFLPRGTVLRGGDVLVAEDGSLVRVKAAPQPVLVVTHCADHGTPFDLLRAAYHLGNRHVPLELQPDRLLLEPDHVLADMLRGQHLIVTEASSAFEPEGGAYGAGAGHAHAGHAHGHDHAHKHDHAHDHGHDHGKHDHGHSHDKPKAAGKAIGIPVVGQAKPHVHGPDCDHDHDHDHGHGHSHGHGHDHGQKKHGH
ncbi:urease accessory protein UreE [Scleromatobacter humisilvae]|uniref:Urease accessory protein UreE n=1 Tax=Scleromatobacter humisilvae TaxID=2897159 RepID=A0A9X2C1V7_9BURK|nr:urease accessory protein UreE [Scleromatobacter humisilvae]MCK9689253.1 urease accessory protein UreE [Scleromatobacter humisilvae]